jgi:hypothetical protein
MLDLATIEKLAKEQLEVASRAEEKKKHTKI